MQHIMIALGLLGAFGLDVVFIHFSGNAAAGLTFAVLGFAILLLLSASAGSFSPVSSKQPLTLALGSLLGQGPVGTLGRVMLGSCIPVLLMLAVVYIPDLDRSIAPSHAIRLGATAATFGLLASLTLAGVVLGFLWPRSGPFESVLVGGMVILDYGMLSWGTVGVSREALQLALYDLMVWPMLCLIGAWVGFSLRRLAERFASREAAAQATAFNTPIAAPTAGAYDGQAQPAARTPEAAPKPFDAGQPGFSGA
ncbi:MAG: hypothetical protein FJ316_11955 [SAR202 cluster bacterium]|nr:hypothetical protein [SAR202 cluster bacterium]